MEQYQKYADKALAPYNITYEHLMKKVEDGKLEIEDGKKKKKVTWSEHYTFTEKSYKEWKDYVIGDLKRKSPQLDEDSINVIFTQIDMVYGLGQPYLFDKYKNFTTVKEDRDDTPDF